MGVNWMDVERLHYLVYGSEKLWQCFIMGLLSSPCMQMIEFIVELIFPL